MATCRDPSLFLLLLLLLLLLTKISLIECHSGCNFISPLHDENVAVQEKLNSRHRTNRRGRTSPILCTQCVSIDTYVTVFANETGAGSEVDQDKVDEQIQILNERFANTPFVFSAVQTLFEVNNDLYDSMEDQEEFIGDAYRRGGLDDLNIYIGGINSGSVAFFPPIQPTNNNDFFSGDGVFLAIDTVPGGSSECCNLGLTLVHEVGHWLGLLHTFEGDSCDSSNPNDYVDDTPQQASPTDFNCPVSRDSCSLLPGNDPVNNYMDYSSDECYTEFSRGQIERMYYVWSFYRDNDDVCPTGYLLLEFNLNTDSTSDTETTWILRSTDGSIEWGSSQPNSGLDDTEYEPNSFFSQDICLPTGLSYNFTLIDANGLDSTGNYSLILAGQLLRSGGAFTVSQTTLFGTGNTPSPFHSPTLAPAFMPGSVDGHSSSSTGTSRSQRSGSNEGKKSGKRTDKSGKKTDKSGKKSRGSGSGSGSYSGSRSDSEDSSSDEESDDEEFTSPIQGVPGGSTNSFGTITPTQGSGQASPLGPTEARRNRVRRHRIEIREIGQRGLRTGQWFSEDYGRRVLKVDRYRGAKKRVRVR